MQSFLHHDWEPWEEWVPRPSRPGEPPVPGSKLPAPVPWVGCRRPLRRFPLPASGRKGYWPRLRVAPLAAAPEAKASEGLLSWCANAGACRDCTVLYCDNRYHESPGYLFAEGDPSSRAITPCASANTTSNQLDLGERLTPHCLPLEEWTTSTGSPAQQEAGAPPSRRRNYGEK